ncbi:MAG: hypothetical protein WB678_02160 [Stellaceae bacterium]
MFDETTFDSRHGERAIDDPVIGLIAEFERKEKLAKAARTREETASFALPADVRNRRPRILIGYLHTRNCEPKAEYASDEATIDLFLRNRDDDSATFRDVEKALGMIRRPKAPRTWLVTELRAERARVEAAYEKSGHAALETQADAFDEEAEAVLDQIEETPPVTLAGADALLELRRRLHGLDGFEDAVLENVLTWLRAAAEARS